MEIQLINNEISEHTETYTVQLEPVHNYTYNYMYRNIDLNEQIISGVTRRDMNGIRGRIYSTTCPICRHPCDDNLSSYCTQCYTAIRVEDSAMGTLDGDRVIRY